jgi:hypothetical protein
MNALAPITRDGSESFRPLLSAPCVSVAELRAFIAETIGLAAVHAGLAETYASLADDRGLEYALSFSTKLRRNGRVCSSKMSESACRPIISRCALAL